MAKNDMRLSVNFIDHPKTKRLMRHTGFEGFYCLLKLWSYTATNFPKGVLKHCDGTFIEEDICRWTGKAGELMEALSDEAIGFLEWDGEDWCVHDWEENQPWVFHAEERSEQARKAVQTRWGVKEEPKPMPKPCPVNAESIQAVQTTAKKPPKRFVKPTVEEVKAYCEKRKNSVDAQRFVDFYESKGWVVGKAPMKDWQSAVRTWEQNNKGKTGGFQKALKPRFATETGSSAVSPDDYNHA